MTFSDFVKRLDNKWGTGFLGEQFELKNGINFSAKQKGRGTLTLDVKNMFGGSTFIDSSELYRVDASPGKERILKNGDILFVRSSVKREGVGWASAFRVTNEPVSFCGFLIRARPLNQNFDSRFLVYYLRQFQVRDRLISRSGQVAITNISQTNLAQLPIPLPPIAEQKRIAGILDAADALRVKRRDAIATLDALLQSTFLTLFGDPVTNPMGWKSVSKTNSSFGHIEELANIADVIDCKHRTPLYTDQGYPVVRPRDVREDGILFEKCLKTTADEFADLTEKRCPGNGDIIYSRNATFGVASLVTTSEKFAIGQDVCLIVPRALNSEFLYYLLNSHFVRRQLGLAISGSTFKRINLKAIRKLKILVPPDSLQEKFALFYAKQQLLRDKLFASQGELDTLFASLQSRAFNGEL